LVMMVRNNRNLGATGGLRLKPMKGQVLATLLKTSAANTALATVDKLTPQSATEFSAYLALYDECKVDSVHCLFNVFANGGTISSSTDWGIAFDPINNTAYTSAPGVLLASQHKFGKMTAGVSTTTVACPQPVNQMGVYKWNIKIPKGATALTNVTDGPTYVGGQWFETGDSDSAANVGYIKTYIPALATGVISNIDFHFVFNCLFRSRT